MNDLRYNDLTLVLDEPRTDGTRVKGFSVHVFDSPAGQAEGKDTVDVPDDLDDLVYRLGSANRTLDGNRDDQHRLARMLGDLLLPDPPGRPNTRQLFLTSRAMMRREGRGLRVRLRCPAVLSHYPWEFAAGPRDDGGAPAFLFLDRELSLARHEALALPNEWLNDAVPGETAGDRPRRRVVYAAASPKPHAKLEALAQERTAVLAALGSLPGVTAVSLPAEPPPPAYPSPGATIAGVEAALAEPRTDVFHFSGHGKYLPGRSGGGALLLADGNDQAAELPAARLAELLRGSRVRLVVLGACNTADRDPRHPWTGLAEALLREGIPAVVAMRYTVSDRLTAAFCAALYQSLIAGRTIDQAVADGRVVIRAKALEMPKTQDARDWSSPVLYLRSPNVRVFRPISDEGAVARATAELEKQHTATVQTVKASGLVIGQLGPSEVGVGQKFGRVDGVAIASLVNPGEQPAATEQTADEVSGILLGVSNRGAEGTAEALQTLNQLRNLVPKKPKKPKQRKKDPPKTE